MRNIDGVKSRRQSRIDVRAGRIANHPCVSRINVKFLDDAIIGCNILLLNDDHISETLLNPRLLDLELLFLKISLRQHDESMSRQQIFKCFLNAIDQLQGMRTYLRPELLNLLDILILNLPLCQAAIRFDQASCEIRRAIAHEAFYLIDHCPYLLCCEAGVIEEGDKIMNSLFKVDVVLPECIVCVDQEMVVHIETFLIVCSRLRRSLSLICIEGKCAARIFPLYKFPRGGAAAHWL